MLDMNLFNILNIFSNCFATKIELAITGIKHCGFIFIVNKGQG